MTALEILDIARNEIGVKEQGVNHVKYVDRYLGTTSYDGSSWPWCVIFVWWCFRQAGADGTVFPDVASCDQVRAFAHNKGRWVTEDYLPGDLVIFDWDGNNSGDHIGIVESVNEDGSLVNIEGNCGDMVQRITRRLSCVVGAYRPDYGEETEGDEDDGISESPAPEPAADGDTVDLEYPDVTYPLVRDGYVGVFASLLQSKLTIYGFDCGDIDGEVGKKTVAAVKKYQAANGLEADGEVGDLTWASLWKGGY